MDYRQPLFTGSPEASSGYDVNKDLKQEALDVISALEARYTAWRGKANDDDAVRIMDDTHMCVIEYIQAMLGINPTLQ